MTLRQLWFMAAGRTDLALTQAWATAFAADTRAGPADLAKLNVYKTARPRSRPPKDAGPTTPEERKKRSKKGFALLGQLLGEKPKKTKR